MGWRSPEERARAAATVTARKRYRSDIKRLFNEGKTDEQIAAEILKWRPGTRASGVASVRQKMGLLRPSVLPEPAVPPMDTDYVISEFKSRAPSTQEEISRAVRGIANDVDRHPDHIRRFLRGQGLIEPRSYEIPEDTLKYAKSLLDDGVPYPEVAREIGMSRERLSDHLPGYAMSPQEAALYRQAKRLAEKVGV